MSALRQTFARLTSLFRKHELDEELEEELRSHIHLAIDDHLRRGMSEAEARRLARLKFGRLDASRDAHRESRGIPWLEAIFHDLRFALRSLLRDRAYTVTAIAMLALAIGLNVTLFTLMNAMLFRGFPMVRENSRIVYMQERDPLRRCCMAFADFEDWRAQAKSFSGLAIVGGAPITFHDAGSARGILTTACEVSANAFSLVGVRPMLGRDFVPADEAPGAAPVAILSYPFWQLRLGGRSGIVGRIVRIDKSPVTIVGVMPEGFTFPEEEDLWVPMKRPAGLQARAPSGFLAFGRLKNGVTVTEARAELETIGRRLAAAYPATNRDRVPTLETWSHFFVGPDGSLIYGSLWAGAWLVLLIACANLANLTLARSIGRSREFSTRIALGSGQWRMMRQILTESLLLTAAGSALGWAIARWGVSAFTTATHNIHQVFNYTMDGGTLAYLGLASAIAVILFSIVPIVRVWRIDANRMLRGDARSVTHGTRARSVAAALVAAQMALAITLLSGAGILVHSFLRVVDADTGVTSPENVLTGVVIAPGDKYADAASRIALFDRLRDRLRAIPGVESESFANEKPVDGPNTRAFDLDSGPGPANNAAGGLQPVLVVTAGSGYFQTIGATTLAGREFNDADRPEGPQVAIVNRRFAEAYWPGSNAIGKRLRLYDGNKPGDWRTVVGVASNIMQGDPLRQRFLPVIYVPFRQQPAAAAWLFARTRVPANQIAPAVQAAVATLDPDIDFREFSTLKSSFKFRNDRMDLAHQDMGRNAALAPIFGAVALLLAVTGLYAAVAHSTRQRTKEIGIRMAIGAAASDVRRLVFREGMLPVAVGLVAGLTASLAVNRLFESQLVGVSPYDPVTLVAAPVVLIVAALLGCQIPARRAMRVDPAVALRED